MTSFVIELCFVFSKCENHKSFRRQRVSPQNTLLDCATTNYSLDMGLNIGLAGGGAHRAATRVSLVTLSRFVMSLIASMVLRPRLKGILGKGCQGHLMLCL